MFKSSQIKNNLWVKGFKCDLGRIGLGAKSFVLDIILTSQDFSNLIRVMSADKVF